MSFDFLSLTNNSTTIVFWAKLSYNTTKQNEIKQKKTEKYYLDTMLCACACAMYAFESTCIESAIEILLNESNMHLNVLGSAYINRKQQ